MTLYEPVQLVQEPHAPLRGEVEQAVRFDDLEPEKRPASSDPSFAALWRETGGEEGIIQRTIKRWRGHGR